MIDGPRRASSMALRLLASSRSHRRTRKSSRRTICRSLCCRRALPGLTVSKSRLGESVGGLRTAVEHPPPWSRPPPKIHFHPLVEAYPRRIAAHHNVSPQRLSMGRRSRPPCRTSAYVRVHALPAHRALPFRVHVHTLVLYTLDSHCCAEVPPFSESFRQQDLHVPYRHPEHY